MPAQMNELKRKAVDLVEKEIWNDEAIDINKKIIGLDNTEVHSYLRLAKCYMEKKDYISARITLMLALQIDPDFVPITLKLNEVNQILNKKPEHTTEDKLINKETNQTQLKPQFKSYNEAFNQALSEKNKGNFQKTIEYLEIALSFKETASAYNVLASSYRQLKNYQKAEEIYKNVLDKNDDIFSKIGLAYVYKDLKEFSKAEGLFKEVLVKNPENQYAISGLESLNKLKENQPFKRNIKTSFEDVSLIKKIINDGENHYNEFKSSLFWDYKKNQVDNEKNLTKTVLKTICAFLNSNGGYLLIGVDDYGTILGLDKDLNTISKNVKEQKDSFQKRFDDLVRDFIGNHVHSCLISQFVNVNNLDIFFVSVKPSLKPNYYKVDNNKKEFYVRRSSSTASLQIDEAVTYILDKFYK